MSSTARWRPVPRSTSTPRSTPMWDDSCCRRCSSRRR